MPLVKGLMRDSGPSRLPDRLTIAYLGKVMARNGVCTSLEMLYFRMLAVAQRFRRLHVSVFYVAASKTESPLMIKRCWTLHAAW